MIGFNCPPPHRRLPADIAKGKRPVGKDIDSEKLWALEESLNEVGR